MIVSRVRVRCQPTTHKTPDPVRYLGADQELYLRGEFAILTSIYRWRHNPNPSNHPTPRPLVRTTFYVDGQIADENTSEPFDAFTWDLKGYELSGEHQILVEAVDSIGLSRTSMPIPVTLTVVQPPRGIAAMFARFRLPIIIGSITLAGLALAFVLLTGLYLTWYWYNDLRGQYDDRVTSKAINWQERLANFVTDHKPTIVTLAVIVVAAAVALSLTTRSRRSSP